MERPRAGGTYRVEKKVLKNVLIAFEVIVQAIDGTNWTQTYQISIKIFLLKEAKRHYFSQENPYKLYVLHLTDTIVIALFFHF